MTRRIVIIVCALATFAAAQYTRQFQSANLGISPYGGSYGYDMDGDGFPNLWTRSSSGTIVVYNSSLAAWWTVSFPGYTYSYLATPRDIDGDGLVVPVNMDGDPAGEVVFSGAEYTTDGYNGRFRVYDGTTRSLEWESPVLAGFNGFANVDDVDGDGKHEVIITRSDYSTYGYVEVYGYSGVGIDGSRRYGLRSSTACAVPTVGRGGTEVSYELAATSRVRLRVLDAAGRLVRELAAAELPAGRYAVRWDGRDDAGQDAPAGAYTWTMEAGDRVETGRLALVR